MKLGLALSGGGIRGIAHAGVLKAFEDNNIKIDIIGGCSSGSLVASLYAMGYSPYYIYILFKRYAKDMANINTNLFTSGLGHFIIGKKTTLKGLKSGSVIEEAYDKISSKKGFNKISDIKMPLVIPTVDLMDSKEYVFTNYIPKGEQNNPQYITDISIGKAVRSSSSFPAVFSPCNMKEHLFMDGGALNNTPVHEVKKQGATKVIAVKFNSAKIDEDSNLMDIIMKTIDIMGSKISEESLEMSDHVLNVYTDKTGLLDLDNLDMCYKFGYHTVIKELDTIKKVLDS